MDTLIVVEPHFELITPREDLGRMLKLLEAAGRTCYKSEAMIKEDSAGKFIQGIVKRGHESVIEHCVITGRFVGDRTMSHQLVRHRIAAYSQESQRYCDYGKVSAMQIVAPPDTRLPPGIYERDENKLIRFTKRTGEGPFRLQAYMAEDNWSIAEMAIAKAFLGINFDAYWTYQWLRNHGLKPEDARLVLPGGSKTEVVTTFNLRMWRHVFEERALNPHAQWQIKKIMRQALEIFGEELPELYGDQLERLKEQVANEQSS